MKLNQMKCFSFPASVRVVRGEGMPQYRNPFEKGDLYIKFNVQFPDNNWISPEKLVVRLITPFVDNCLSGDWFSIVKMKTLRTAIDKS